MPSQEEHRLFSRSPIGFNVTLTCEDGTIVNGQSVNVGFGGLSVKSDKAVPEGSKCTVSIELSNGQSIESKGNIVRVADHNIVIEFYAIRESDLDHFDNIVRYNSEDADGIIEDQPEAVRPILDLY